MAEAGPFHFWFVERLSYHEGCWVLLHAFYAPIEKIPWFLSFIHTAYYID